MGVLPLWESKSIAAVGAMDKDKAEVMWICERESIKPRWGEEIIKVPYFLFLFILRESASEYLWATLYPVSSRTNDCLAKGGISRGVKPWKLKPLTGFVSFLNEFINF